MRSLGYAVRGSTATQPAGSSTYATSPLVAAAFGSPHAVWVRSASVRSTWVESRQIRVNRLPDLPDVHREARHAAASSHRHRLKLARQPSDLFATRSNELASVPCDG